MTTNRQDTQSLNSQAEPARVAATPTSTPVSNSTGVSGVAVYDQGPDGASNSSRPSMSMMDDSAPATSRSSGSVIAWVIGIVVLIILAYFILQMLF